MILNVHSEIISKYAEKDIVIFDSGNLRLIGVIIDGYAAIDKCDNTITIYYDILTSPDDMTLGNYKIFRGINEESIITSTTIKAIQALLGKLDWYETIMKEEENK